MILNILIFKNLKIKAFTTPQFDDHDPKDAAEQLRRALIVEKDVTKVNPYKNLELYCVGSFDDLTGELTVNEPEFLLSCADVVKTREDYVESGEISRD